MRLLETLRNKAVYEPDGHESSRREQEIMEAILEQFLLETIHSAFVHGWFAMYFMIGHDVHHIHN